MWKPKTNEDCYFPDTADGTPKFVKLTWRGSPIQENFYRLGAVCKTADEAIEKARRPMSGSGTGQIGGKNKKIPRKELDE